MRQEGKITAIGTLNEFSPGVEWGSVRIREDDEFDIDLMAEQILRERRKRVFLALEKSRGKEVSSE